MDGRPPIGPNTTYPQDSFSPAGGANFVAPYKLGSGVMRGTQIILGPQNSQITLGAIPKTTDFGIQLNAPTGGASITMDATSNAFYLTAADGSKIGMGQIPDDSGDFGFFMLDPSGFLLFKMVSSTQYWYDKSFQTNTGQAGLLPNGLYGWVFVPPANNVTDAFG